MARRYYIDRYSDEVVPCDCTLEGWAAWLAKGGNRGEAGRDEGDSWSFAPPAHGTEYRASVLHFLRDVTVTRDDADGLTFNPPLIEGLGFAAVGSLAGGWGCDEILDPGAIAEGLTDEICPLIEKGETGTLAVAFNEPDVTLRFELGEGGTPRLIVAGVLN